MNRVKKVLISIWIFFITIPTKIYAATMAITPDLYGPPSAFEKPTLYDKIMRLFKTIFIPVILLIGILMYLQESKSSKKKKLLIVTGLIVIVVIVYKLFLS